MKSKLLGASCLFAFLSFASQPLFADTIPTFNKIIFFGDSLTDNGNFYNHSGHVLPKYPPYYNGRFSNGYNWADLVSNDLFSKFNIVSENYAVGGATAVLHNPLQGYLPVTLSMEKDDYNVQYILKDKTNTLYVIWIGGNDYLQGADNVDLATTNVIDAITTTVQSLSSNKGAAFLVIGMPDLSLTPQAVLKNLGDNYKALATMHNQKLHAAIMNLQAQYPDTKFMEFNFLDHPVLNEIVSSQSYRDEINKKYGINITNVTDACWGGSLLSPSEKNIQKNLMLTTSDVNNKSVVDTSVLAKEIAHSASLLETYRVQEMALRNDQRCADADQYLFWDNVHPTAATHKVLAGMLMDVIMDSH